MKKLFRLIKKFKWILIIIGGFWAYNKFPAANVFVNETILRKKAIRDDKGALILKDGKPQYEEKETAKA